MRWGRGQADSCSGGPWQGSLLAHQTHHENILLENPVNFTNTQLFNAPTEEQPRLPKGSQPPAGQRRPSCLPGQEASLFSRPAPPPAARTHSVLSRWFHFLPLPLPGEAASPGPVRPSPGRLCSGWLRLSGRTPNVREEVGPGGGTERSQGETTGDGHMGCQPQV